MVTVSNPIWKEVKIDLLKGLKPALSVKSKEYIELASLNLKQYDMFGKFPSYIERHIFVKLVAK